MLKICLIICVITITFADQIPTNYVALNGAGRADQQQTSNFAVWNDTSRSWKTVLPHGASGIFGTVSVGGGILAYGSMTSFSGGQCNGLLFYNGEVWSAPENLNVFKYTPSNTQTRYQNRPSSSGKIFGATVVGNDVYIIGDFNQIGLERGGIAGFAKLTWQSRDMFTVGTVGRGYFEAVANVCPSTCPTFLTTLIASPKSIKLMSFTYNTELTFVAHVAGNLMKFVENGQEWEPITRTGNGNKLTDQVVDFDIFNNVIYVVGNFDNTLDSTPLNRYLHIARSSNAGQTWTALSDPQPLTYNEWATLLPTFDINSNTIIFQGSQSVGLTAIYVESDSSIYVAGGYRVNSRNITDNNLANIMQTKVFQITNGNTITPVSQRFGLPTSTNPQVGPTINRIMKNNGSIWVYGDFHTYNYVIPSQVRYGSRYTNILKGAAYLQNGLWYQGHGGFLTTSTDTNIGTKNTDLSIVVVNSVFYFTRLEGATNPILNSWGFTVGGVVGFNGDSKSNNFRPMRWNQILNNLNFVSAMTYTNGNGQNGAVNVLHMTSNNALIIGGMFDYIGQQTIGGVAWYNPRNNQALSCGGGLYQMVTDTNYGADNIYNSRFGGEVYDIEERGDYLYAGGIFNRNGTGFPLYNVAQLKYTTSGRGWEQLDGGCNGVVRDLLVVNNLLYITGGFQFCGLSQSYEGGLSRGRVPHSYIAVIDLSDSKKSWRNLGLGLNGEGYSLAARGRDLFVGGDFSSAGGKLNTGGIARWRGDHWEDVVAKCRANCDRPNNVYFYHATNVIVNPNDRKPQNCYNLRNYNGRIYCIDENGKRLSYFGTSNWYTAGDYKTVALTNFKSNTLIGRNASDLDQIFTAIDSTSDFNSNGQYISTYDEALDNYVPTYTGFSKTINSFSNANVLYASFFLVFISFIIIF